MPEASKEEIEARAYQLWEQAGRPVGREKEFWNLAEQELRNEDKSSPTRTPDTLWRNRATYSEPSTCQTIATTGITSMV
jgi:Protein of unknown function (DUF2934)